MKAREVPLTLLAAPAGFGKTTLLAAWCAQMKTMQVAWLSLEPNDDDPARFLMYVSAALATIDPEPVRGIQALLETLPAIPPQQILTTLLNGLANRHEPIALALDDVHNLELAAVNALLAFLIEHCPPCLHLLLVTRADPDVPLARYRARGS